MNINVRNFSDEELNTFQEEINRELSRRRHIDKLVENINELLYELAAMLTEYEHLSFVHNQLGNELFNTKNVEELEGASGWFAPALHIERTVSKPEGE